MNEMTFVKNADGSTTSYINGKEMVTASFKKAESALEDNVDITPSNTQQIVTPTSGYDGFKQATVSAVALEQCNATPTTSSQTLTPTSPNVGFNEVNVEAVTSSIDSNIQAENIKKDVSILGVTGTFEGGEGIIIPTVTNLTVTNGIASWTAPNLSDLTAYNPSVSYLVYCNNNFVEETNSTSSNVIAWLNTGDNEVSVIVKIKLDNTEDTETTSSVTTVRYTYSQIHEFGWSTSSNPVCIEELDNKLYVYQGYYNTTTYRNYMYDLTSGTSTLLTSGAVLSSYNISFLCKYNNIIYYRYRGYLYGYVVNTSSLFTVSSNLDNINSYGILVDNLIYEIPSSYNVTRYIITNLDTYTQTSVNFSGFTNGGCGRAYYNRNIYMFGGYSQSNSYTKSIYKFNIDTNQVELLTVELPTVIRYCVATTLGDKIYIMYGETSNSTYSTKIYMFDPILETITTLSRETTHGDSSMSSAPRTCVTKDAIYSIGTTNYRNKIKRFLKIVG